MGHGGNWEKGPPMPHVETLQLGEFRVLGTLEPPAWDN